MMNHYKDLDQQQIQPDVWVGQAEMAVVVRVTESFTNGFQKLARLIDQNPYQAKLFLESLTQADKWINVKYSHDIEKGRTRIELFVAKHFCDFIHAIRP